MGLVTEYLKDVIAKQIASHGLVVWFDPQKDYETVAGILAIPGAETFQWPPAPDQQAEVPLLQENKRDHTYQGHRCRGDGDVWFGHLGGGARRDTWSRRDVWSSGAGEGAAHAYASGDSPRGASGRASEALADPAEVPRHGRRRNPDHDPPGNRSRLVDRRGRRSASATWSWSTSPTWYSWSSA